MLEPFVVAKGVGRDFPQGDRGTRRVLQGVDCLVLPGDRIALTGPSGSGKSTLLAILGGLDHPTSGSVIWPGLRPMRSSGRPPDVAFVFQSPSLLPALDVRLNVCLPLMLDGQMRGMEERANEMLAAFGLDALADKLPGELSGGQAQRVALARALMTTPWLILADEPTGQLDHPTAHHVLDTLLGLISGSETALIIASHDRTISEKMDTSWALDKGQLETQPDEELVQ